MKEGEEGGWLHNLTDGRGPVQNCSVCQHLSRRIFTHTITTETCHTYTVEARLFLIVACSKCPVFSLMEDTLIFNEEFVKEIYGFLLLYCVSLFGTWIRQPILGFLS